MDLATAFVTALVPSFQKEIEVAQKIYIPRAHSGLDYPINSCRPSCTLVFSIQWTAYTIAVAVN